MRRRGSILPGLLLLALGVFLLLDRTRLVIFGWDLFLPALAFLLGLVMLVECMKPEARCRPFWGTLLVVFGGFFFLWNNGTLDYLLYDYWPIFPTAFGLAFIAQFLAKQRGWLTLIFGVILALTGGSYFLDYFGYIDVYSLQDIAYRIEDLLYLFFDYYPVAIIVIGILLIFSSIRRSHAGN